MQDMGQLFGLSAHAIGKRLKQLGWREPDGTPSQAAEDAGLVGQARTVISLGRHRKLERTVTVWHRQRLYDALIASGLVAVGDPHDELFVLAAQTNALLMRAQKRQREGNETRARWAHQAAERHLGAWMKPLASTSQAEQASRVVHFLVHAFGWSRLVAEDVINASVSRERVRRQALLEQCVHPNNGTEPNRVRAAIRRM